MSEVFKVVVASLAKLKHATGCKLADDGQDTLGNGALNEIHNGVEPDLSWKKKLVATGGNR
jgi:hypothetical protein